MSVTTNIRTYILSSDLNCVATLDDKYSAISVYGNLRFCLTSNCEIHVYDSNWIFVMTLDIGKKIKSITKNRYLFIIDIDDRYYIFGDDIPDFKNSKNQEKHTSITICDISYTIYKLHGENKVHRLISNCKHLTGCDCDSKLMLFFCHDLIIIYNFVDKKIYETNPKKYLNIMIDNESCTVINGDVLVMMDKLKNIFLYRINKLDQCIDLSKLHHELKFKIKKKINMKSANF